MSLLSVDEAALRWWRRLPPMLITLVEMKRLPEYSASIPTGVVVGKRWRRHNGAHDVSFLEAGGIARWVICQYEEAPDDFRNVLNPDGTPGPVGGRWAGYIRKRVQMCKTVTYRPVIRVAAPTRKEEEYV
jgi:hypothetical protein